MKSADQIAIEYAENRAELRSIKSMIDALLHNSDGKYQPIDLAEIRSEEIHEGENIEWYGWEALADNAASYPPTDEDIRRIELGKLLDKKKAVVAAAGEIKRGLYNAGNALIRATTEQVTET